MPILATSWPMTLLKANTNSLFMTLGIWGRLFTLPGS